MQAHNLHPKLLQMLLATGTFTQMGAGGPPEPEADDLPFEIVELPRRKPPHDLKPYKILIDGCTLHFKKKTSKQYAKIALDLRQVSFSHAGLAAIAQQLLTKVECNADATLLFLPHQLAHFTGALTGPAAIKKLPISILRREYQPAYHQALKTVIDPAAVRKITCGTAHGAYALNAPVLIGVAALNIKRIVNGRHNAAFRQPLVLRFGSQASKVNYFPELLELPGNWCFVAKSARGKVGASLNEYAAEAQTRRVAWKYAAARELAAMRLLPAGIIEEIVCTAVLIAFTDKIWARVIEQKTLLCDLANECARMRLASDKKN